MTCGRQKRLKPRFTSFASKIAGATNRTIESKTVAIHLEHDILRDHFLSAFRNHFGISPAQAMKTNIVIGRLYSILRSHWSTAIRTAMIPDIILDLDSDEIKAAIKPSVNDVYYVSGWMLRKLTSLNCSQDKPIMERFVEANSLSISAAETKVNQKFERGNASLKF